MSIVTMENITVIIQIAFFIIIPAGCFYAYKTHKKFINGILAKSQSRPINDDYYD
jgi:cbb3-type cytochrome oxidase subunit 3